jgi:DNA polymerase-4
MAREIKREILAAVHLTSSVGVAPNRFLAKIASDVNKPDGLTLIAADQVEAFIDRLPIGKVSGVGPKTQTKLEGMGVRYLGEIRKFPEPTLESIFGLTACGCWNSPAASTDPVTPIRRPSRSQ